MKDQVIFIHSLFRAGSTYLFSVFRRTENYTCYQESLHEIAFFAKDKPEILLEDQGKTHILRHPPIGKPYFQELYDSWPVWKNVINEDSIYNNYFSIKNRDTDSHYWQSLIEHSKNISVFQECRTSNRIRTIKEELGGHHLYLWRNPWDQWWSYKVNPYFDVANQLIIQAVDPPIPIKLLKSALKIEKYKLTNLAVAFANHFEKPLTSEESYMIFYMLWCLGLNEGIKHADLLINIDMLSDQNNYQQHILKELAKANITEIDFSDCHIPNAIYAESDQSFFLPLEEKVHDWLKQGGWTQNELSQIFVMRQQYQPKSWYTHEAAILVNNDLEQNARARNLARFFETGLAQQTRKFSEEISTLKANAQEINNQVSSLKQEALLSENRVQQEANRAEIAEQRAMAAENRAQQEANRAEIAEQRAMAAENRAQQEANRFLQAEQRAQNADLLANQAYQRANNAEHLVVQLELRARETDLVAMQARQQLTEQTILKNELSIQIKQQLLEIQELRNQFEQQQQDLLATEQMNAQLQAKVYELGGNSHHWYTSYQALEQIVEASKTIDRVEYTALEERIKFLGNNSHHWYTVAMQHQQMLNAVYSSRSWKITYPMRNSKLLLRKLLNPQAIPKKILKRFILQFNQTLYKYPNTRLKTLALIRKLPFPIEQHLRLLVRANAAHMNTLTSTEYTPQTVYPDTQLPTQAQASYELLKQL